MLLPLLAVFHKRQPPVGSRPGTLVMADNAVKPRIGVMWYDQQTVDETALVEPGDLKTFLDRGGVTWIDVQGLGDEKALRTLAEIFSIHALALEDVVNVPQRPKIEAYADHALIVTRMMKMIDMELDAEQVSIFVGRGYVLTFQERYGDILDPVRSRVREGKGPIRTAGADYLAYAVLDTIVDGYYPVIQEFGDALGRIEDRIMVRPSQRHLEQLTEVRATLAGLHRAFLPQREALSRLIRDGSTFISADVRVYLRDTYDHCAQLADVVEGSRDMANGLLNTYLSLIGARTNEVMKVLTIMASIFIPLTFLAGIYGMNFEAMPELHRRWAYPVLLGFMFLCAVGMLVYFRRKGWLGGGTDDDDEA